MRHRATPGMRVGVDTGGTFTDFVGLDGRTIVTHKRRSTPDDASRAMLDGLGRMRPAVGSLRNVIHGSTVATNAVLEGRAARVALVTTAGFEDVIQIARQTRPELYNIFVKPRPTLVDPLLVFGVTERLAADGTVLTALDAGRLDHLVATVKTSGAEIVAICLLHSYVNPAHEQRIARRFRAAGVAACTSSDVLPEYREYERWSTTVVNAAVTPVMDRYLGRLEAALGSAVRLSVMQSNGGTVSAATARAQAIRTILSGPAGGVVGARAVATSAGVRRIIAFDMGGTSTDVSLIDGPISTSSETAVGTFPIRVPVIDIHTIGAGGGSIAWIDHGGGLRVGPHSAGAAPGPACYGTGDLFTVTDANLLLGRLDADRFLGGRMPLDVRRSQTAAAPLAAALGRNIDSLAEGVIRVVNASMERAVWAVSVERGHDPRRFTLVAFGGAGGMHACDIAEALGLTRVLVPRYAGVLSALGMLAADVTRDYVASVLSPSARLTPRGLDRQYRPLEARARADLRREGLRGTETLLTRSIDVRYVGQSHELTLPHTTALDAAFHRAHQRRYGYADRARPVEVVNIRVTAIGRTSALRLPRARSVSRRPATPVARRPALFNGRVVRSAVYAWTNLESGMAARGPAVVVGGDATAVLPPAWQFTVDAWGNLNCARRSR